MELPEEQCDLNIVLASIHSRGARSVVILLTPIFLQPRYSAKPVINAHEGLNETVN